MRNEKLKHILYLARNDKGFLLLYFLILVLATMFESMGLGMLMPIFQSMGGAETNHFFTAYAMWGFGLVGLEYSFTNLILVFSAATLVKYALVAVSMRCARLISSRATYDLRERAFRNLMNLPLSFFYSQKVGDLVAVQFTSANNAGVILEYAMLIMSGIFFCTLYLAMNLMVSFWLTVIVVGLSAVSYLFLLPRFQSAYGGGKKESQGMENINSYLYDVFSGIKTVKVFGNARHHVDNYGRHADDYRRVCIQIMDNRIIASLFHEPLFFIFMVLCLVLSVQFLELPFVTLAVFLVIFLQVIPKLKVICNQWVKVNELIPHLLLILECGERKRKTYLPEGCAPLGVLEKGVRFEDVSFSYPGVQNSTLSGISVLVEQGKTTALVGSSGGGKTTLVDLFLRLHDPSRGVIYVDDVDLRDVPLAEWRSRIGVVEQEPHLFHDTVYNNIRYGNLDADEGQVRKAAETACAHAYIEKLPEGYETIIGNRGFRLSGGQKQRLALARALVRSPQILVLDEATSSLDSESEHLIQTAVQELSGRMTILIVAHRLSTIRNADRIFVLDGGRVVQEGDHAALIGGEGRYREFMELQS